MVALSALAAHQVQMPSRYPLLWLKKRGKRRSGAPRWGHSGELLYHTVFVVVGLAACLWQATEVIAPDWRQREEVALFDRAECRIEDAKLQRQEGQVWPVWTVRLLRDGVPLDRTDRAIAAGTVANVRESRRLIERFSAGEQTTCWIDPESPSRIVLSSPFRWGPWFVLLIPLSLVGIGVVGLVRTVLRAGASIERRHAVAQQASKFDPFAGSRVSIALATGLPPTTDVNDSPGVKLRYRLPIEGAASWRLVGMAVMCVAWNLLVGFFLVGVITDLVYGQPNWPVTLVVIPLACAGGWLAYSLLRDALAASGVGVTQVEIAMHPLMPGQTGGGVILQAGQFRARWLNVSLVCDEIATFCEGTDTRTSTQEVYRELLHRERRFRVAVDRPFEQAFTFTVPENAMHSFLSPHNEVRWSLEVRASPMRWPEFRRRFRLCVYPSNWQGLAEKQQEHEEALAEVSL